MMFPNAAPFLVLTLLAVGLQAKGQVLVSAQTDLSDEKPRRQVLNALGSQNDPGDWNFGAELDPPRADTARADQRVRCETPASDPQRRPASCPALLRSNQRDMGFSFLASTLARDADGAPISGSGVFLLSTALAGVAGLGTLFRSRC